MIILGCFGGTTILGTPRSQMTSFFSTSRDPKGKAGFQSSRKIFKQTTKKWVQLAVFSQRCFFWENSRVSGIALHVNVWKVDLRLTSSKSPKKMKMPPGTFGKIRSLSANHSDLSKTHFTLSAPSLHAPKSNKTTSNSKQLARKFQSSHVRFLIPHMLTVSYYLLLYAKLLVPQCCWFIFPSRFYRSTYA